MIDRKQDIITTVPEQHTVEALEEEFLMIPDFMWISVIVPIAIAWIIHKKYKEKK